MFLVSLNIWIYAVVKWNLMVQTAKVAGSIIYKEV